MRILTQQEIYSLLNDAQSRIYQSSTIDMTQWNEGRAIGNAEVLTLLRVMTQKDFVAYQNDCMNVGSKRASELRKEA